MTFVKLDVSETVTAALRARLARREKRLLRRRRVAIRQVGRELGVRYVLEGSVRKSGNRVRVTGQLIEAESGSHVWADKFDGAVHNPPFRNIAIAMNEPIGTVGVICPTEAPLLGFLSLVMPLLAVGNTVVTVPSEKYPLITGDLYQLFDTSDLPGGAINIVTGYAAQLLKTLAEHDDVDGIWCYGDEATVAAAKAMSTGNLKQVWTNEGRVIDWFNSTQAEGRWCLEHATQVKNIWVPYGE